MKNRFHHDQRTERGGVWDKRTPNAVSSIEPKGGRYRLERLRERRAGLIESKSEIIESLP